MHPPPGHQHHAPMNTHTPPPATVTITITDTPDGVTVHSSFSPALGQRITPAQSVALDAYREACKLAGAGQHGRGQA